MKYDPQTKTVVLEKPETEAYFEESKRESKTQISFIDWSFIDWMKSHYNETHPGQDTMWQQAINALYSADNMIISGDIRSVPPNMFLNEKNLNLKSLTVEKGVEWLDYRSFSGIGSVQEVFLPDGITIEGSVFRDSGIEFISFGATAGYTTAPDITFDATYVFRADGWLSESICQDCHELKEVEFRQPIYGINDDAFWGCNQLNKIDLSGVKDIRWHAFNDCHNLDVSQEKFVSLNYLDSAFDGCMFSDNAIHVSEYSRLMRYPPQFRVLPENVEMKCLTDTSNRISKMIPDQFEEIVLKADAVKKDEQENSPAE